MPVPIRTWPALDVTLHDPAAADLVLALLDDFHPTAIEQPEASALRAYFATAADRDDAARALEPQFSTALIDVTDEGWAERSQAATRTG